MNCCANSYVSSKECITPVYGCCRCEVVGVVVKEEEEEESCACTCCCCCNICNKSSPTLRLCKNNGNLCNCELELNKVREKLNF